MVCRSHWKLTAGLPWAPPLAQPAAYARTVSTSIHVQKRCKVNRTLESWLKSFAHYLVEQCVPACNNIFVLFPRGHKHTAAICSLQAFTHRCPWIFAVREGACSGLCSLGRLLGPLAVLYSEGFVSVQHHIGTVHCGCTTCPQATKLSGVNQQAR